MRKILAVVIMAVALNFSASASIKHFFKHPALLKHGYHATKAVVKETPKVVKTTAVVTGKILF
jgi:hypothetical protein